MATYEFDAPSLVVDLKEFDRADDADHWFEERSVDRQLATPARSDSWCDRVHTQNAAHTRTKPSAQPGRVSKRKEANASAEIASAVIIPPEKKQKRSSVGRRARQHSGNVRRSHRTVAPATSKMPNGSEAQELERIKTLQREVAEHRRRNEASYKAALAGNHPPKITLPFITIPKEFHFCTDSRVKASEE
ncbi:hypothetical protein CRUP_028828, partial [Coryphaenoides rupestris]